jgi:hypothetical protein
MPEDLSEILQQYLEMQKKLVDNGASDIDARALAAALVARDREAPLAGQRKMVAIPAEDLASEEFRVFQREQRGCALPDAVMVDLGQAAGWSNNIRQHLS